MQEQKSNDNYKKGEHTAKVALVVTFSLASLEFLAGVVGKSHAVIADSLHTFSDFLATIAVFVGFKIAQKPPDEEHPYGHGRAESIAGKIVSLVLIALGIKVGYDAIVDIFVPDVGRPEPIALWAAFAAILVQEGLYRYTNRLAKKLDSTSLTADARHHRSDVYSSVAVLIGVFLARVGLPYFDHLAAIAVAGLVIKLGTNAFHKAYDELMDAPPSEALVRYLRMLANQINGVEHITDIKVRKMGLDLFVDMKIEVDKAITVEAGHKITDEIRSSIFKKVPNTKDIFIHVEPHRT